MQNERVKEVRKTLNLTLEKFGKRIGLKKSAVSLIESGRNSLTDANIKSICREFNVNETWLRTGEGDMFVPMTRDEEIAKFVGELLKDEDESFKKRLISGLAKMDDRGWDLLEEFLDSIEPKEKGTG